MKLTDAEKTRRLAEGCMGWHKKPRYIHSEKDSWHDAAHRFKHFVCNWQPLHNEAHAAEVREAMRAKGWLMIYRMMPTCDAITFEHFSKQRQIVFVDIGCAPLGICHAALLALGLAQEEEL